MARIRSLKPEFWDDRKLARATSRDARMLYMGMWNQADEHGRLNGDAVWLKGRVFPYDDDIETGDLKALLDELEAAGRIQRYEVEGDPFIYLPKLAEHQRLEPGKVESRHPEPPEPPKTRASKPRPDIDANQSEPRADQSEPDSDDSALLYGSGSMEHGSGVMVVSSGPDADATHTDRPAIDELCRHLANRIEANGAKRPTITTKWHDATRLMLDRDGRTETSIRAAIDWSQSHEFWRANILSMPKLREKYDQLSLQAQRPGSPGNRSPGATQEHIERARQRLRSNP